MNRILLEASELDAEGRARLADRRAFHIVKELKAVVGQRIRVGVIDGPPGAGVVETIADGSVVLACALGEPRIAPPRIDLLLALPRPKVMKRLWAPLASLGVGRVILTNAAKVERQYFDTHVLKPESYRPLLIEGLQQAGDTRLPRVRICRQLKPFIEDELDGLFPGAVRLVADPSARRRIADVAFGSAGRVLIAVGPEGGWNDFELELLAAHGFAGVSMGCRTLRTDVACIALLALITERLA